MCKVTFGKVWNIIEFKATNVSSVIFSHAHELCYSSPAGSGRKLPRKFRVGKSNVMYCSN